MPAQFGNREPVCSDWPKGYARIEVEEVTSTLDAAAARIDRQPVPFWLLARKQTAARGRRGRAWHMPEGNFAATLVLDAGSDPKQAALRSFVISLALHRALSEETGCPEAFTLKWPNDVLLSGAKLAGILLERGGSGAFLSIGVGVNLRQAPPRNTLEETALPPASLAADLGFEVGPDRFLETLARHYAVLETDFRAEGFAPIRRAWLSHAARLGEIVTARVGQREVTGIFEDVDADGHLVLRGPRGTETIAAADVYF